GAARLDLRQGLAPSRDRRRQIAGMSGHWERVEQVFHAALDLPNEERDGFLREACAGDFALAEEVKNMLRSHTSAAEFLEQPALELHAEFLAAEEGTLRSGSSLGSYQIVRLLGSGGMGEVYLADDPELGRKVAIKLVRRGFGTPDFVRHLRHEARILASLNDPHIARLYGGAVTPEGVPYFVMEYVEGERLDHFCAERRLTANEKLELFRKVCSAVAHAHQHLVIHRDLKPANIWVTPDGEPKLLDFGIAKLLDPETTTAGDPTITLASAMTPDYASPEQIRGEPMTTSSDIYSLGVILYELLTGDNPYRLTSRRPHEAARVITETQPVRPSLLRRELAGDLDNILLMALRKEPERRYPSAGQFSDDLHRHLAGLPVLAHKDTAVYRAKKFVRRHRGAMTAAVLVLLALVGGLVIATWQARVARLAQVKAETSRKQADRLNQFMEDLLATADPAKMGKDGKKVPLLDAASARLDHEMADEPAVLARAHETLSRAYQHLGVYTNAELHARAALALERRLHGPEDPALAHAELLLGDVLNGRYRQAKAEPVLRNALAIERRQPVPDHGALAETLDDLSLSYASSAKPRLAEPLAEEALKHARVAWSEQDPRFLRLPNEIGVIKVAERNYAAAEEIFRRLIWLYDQQQPGGIGSIAPQINLGICLFNEGTLAEVEKVLDRLQSDTLRLVGEHGLPFALALHGRGCLDFARGEYEAAIPFLRRSLATLTANYPPGQTTVVQSRAVLGLCLTRTGHADEGEPLLRRALADGKKVEPMDFAHTFGNLETALGECLLAQKRYAEAEPLLLGGYADLDKRLGSKNRFTAQAAHRLHEFYIAWDKPVQASQFASANAPR
ncbi:MAG: protein kinase domain-containing protein, partial [Rhodanobacteraceae bacterium]